MGDTIGLGANLQKTAKKENEDLRRRLHAWRERWGLARPRSRRRPGFIRRQSPPPLRGYVEVGCPGGGPAVPAEPRSCGQATGEQLQARAWAARRWLSLLVTCGVCDVLLLVKRERYEVFSKVITASNRLLDAN